MPDITVHKIKISDGKPTLSHSAPDAKGERVRYDDIEYHGTVHKDFQLALDSFAVDLALEPELIDTPDLLKNGEFFMHSLSIKDGKGGGVTLSGHKIKSNGGAFNFNTSFIHFAGKGDTAYPYLEELTKKIERVQKEAIAYLDGSKRGVDQMDLFSQPPAEPITSAQILPATPAAGTFRVETAAGFVDLPIELPENGVIAEIKEQPADEMFPGVLDTITGHVPPNTGDVLDKMEQAQVAPPKTKGTATGRKRVQQTAANPSGIVE